MTLDEKKILLTQAASERTKRNLTEAITLALQVIEESESESEVYAQAQLSLAETEIMLGKIEEARTRALQVIEVAGRLQSRMLKAGAWTVLGHVYLRQYMFAQALEFLTMALKEYEELGEKSQSATVRGSVGVVYRRHGQYEKALEHLLRAESEFSELDDVQGQARAAGNIGNVYASMGSHSTALEYLGKAFERHQKLGNTLNCAEVTGNIGFVYQTLGYFNKALEYQMQSLALMEELQHLPGIATVLVNVGYIYIAFGSYAEALDFFSRALATHEQLNNRVGISEAMRAIGKVYHSMGSLAKAKEYFEKALVLQQIVGNKTSVAGIYQMIAEVYADNAEYERSAEFFNRALSIFEEFGDRAGVSGVLSDIATASLKSGRYSEAHAYALKALEQFEEMGSPSGILSATATLGSIYANENFKDCDEVKAENYIRSAIRMSEIQGEKRFLYEQHKALAALLERQERWKEHSFHFKKYHETEKEVLTEEARNKSELLEQMRLVAEREKEIAIARATAMAELKATTGLLHKVLPQSIATRLIGGEEEIADFFPNVSILFADISGFTPLTANMPAIIVVRFLNFVFAQFDRIIKTHGCEKIKTIGDGYMAVAGAPLMCDDHAERITSAALEMMKSIHLSEDIRSHMPQGTTFGIRIGLHTGPVVAGVIGEERFVYDVYSDAVNTAARMESHGQPNKIHVSSEFMKHLQHRFVKTKNQDHGLVFEERGEIEIKGKGMMRTYFLTTITTVRGT